MEDDDEFGDLYTDVLRPLTTTLQPQRGEGGAAGAVGKVSSSQSRPIDLNINSDDEEILYGAPDLKNNNSNSNTNTNPTSALGWNLNAPIQEKTLAEPRGFDLNLDSNSETRVDGIATKGGDGLGFEGRVLEKGDDAKILQKAPGTSNFMDDEDDINILVEERENKDEDLVNREDTLVSKEDNSYVSATPKEKAMNIVNQSLADEMSTEQMIPGLSGRLDNPRGSNFEDEWESDESEDDLQIVLNDNNHGPMGMERMPGIVDEDDEDGEPLVIVADNGDVGHQPHMMMEDQEWGGEEGAPGPDGEKDAGDAAKPSGGGAAAPAAVPPKIAYGNHMYHQPFHSQYKYVRPGAAPLPGAAPAAPGGIPGQVRPPVNMGPLAGRGRGDWRPPGMKGGLPMQKGFHPGYGMPAWGANAAGRGYGSGLDFTLPSHKTIFEVDIDTFEEKPWKLPGIDMSDFFNFDLNEDSWKEYCKQLEQLRLATTMQSKIRVYESGRTEQDYDPDLPPELAAAVGIQDIPSDNANSGKADGGPTDLARGTARGRIPLPVGRPIPVETGSGDRLPSIDTRRPRLHDNDAIIEIVCQGSTDGDGMADQQEDDPARKDVGGGDETHDLQQQDVEHMDSFSPSYNGQKRGTESRKIQLKNIGNSDEIVREDGSRLPPDVPVHYHPDRGSGVPHDERYTKGRGRVRSPVMTAGGKNSGKHIADNQNEESFDSGDRKRTPTLSSSGGIGSDEEQAVVVADDMNDGSVMDDRSFDVEREEMNVGAANTKKQKISSNHSQEDECEDSKGGRSSENNNKARSGSSKDQRRFPDDVEDEVLQDGHPPRAGNIKREVGDEDINAHRKGYYDRDETGRHNMVGKGREDSFSRRGGDSNSSLRRYVKGESADWRKESDISEGNWHGRRPEDPRKREHGGEIGSRNRAKVRESEKSEKDEHRQSRNHLDSGSWKGVNHDHNIVRSRQRDRDDNTKSRNEKVDDLHIKRRKEEAHLSREFAEKEDMSQNYREGNSRRKRERDDAFDQARRDDLARMKDDDVHYPRQKEGVSFQRERSERQRERDDWYRVKQDEVLSRREREETRPVMRSGRAAEDKTWASHSRGKDDYKGSNREYHPKRRDQVESESFSQHRSHEDVYAPPGNQYNNDEKRARFERPSSRDRRVAYGSDNTKAHEHKRKESNRKSRESESGDQSSKRNRDEHGGQITDTVSLRGRTEQQNDEIHPNRQSTRKHNKEPASSDDEHPGSRKGRSKLERWTSHKERDFALSSMPSPSLRNRDPVTSQTEEASKKAEETPPQPSADDKNTGNAETNNNNVNPEDKHLDTVAKLKKRSERFKLPMPSEKDTVAIKKMESEPLPLAHTAEIRPDSEIKSERPARKRRWISN